MYQMGEETKPCPFPVTGNGHGPSPLRGTASIVRKAPRKRFKSKDVISIIIHLYYHIVTVVTRVLGGSFAFVMKA